MQLKTEKTMGNNLVIVESPAKARTIQRFLGEGYVVKPSFGHIRDLQDNKLSVDVGNGFQPQYVIPEDKKKVVAELKKLSQKADSVWLASDEDREGEAISWHLYETLGLEGKDVKRIVFHEITKNAIQNAVLNPRTIDMNLVDAQQARRVLDRLVGFELSPVLWRKIQPKLSAGRVQSVALRLVTDREKEIMAFVNEPYYRVDASFSQEGERSKLPALLDTRFKNIEEARSFLEDCIGAEWKVTSVDKKEATRFPAPPFTTSTLQQEAARKLHFPVSLTMRIAQSLYERGLITYMRTDSTNLSAMALGTAKDFIQENYGAAYTHQRQFHTHSKGAQEAHEAIRPTFIQNTGIEGTAQEKKLYELIWKRTVASQMSEARVINTSVKIATDARSERFTVQGTQILFDGFLKVYMEGHDDEDAVSDSEQVTIPDLHEGDRMLEKGIKATCKFTQAPPRYSEATLVKKLEELGIGRPSTYAPTISTLTTGRGYISKGDKPGRNVEVRNLTLKNKAITESTHTETVGAERGKLLPEEIGMIVSDWLLANFTEIMDYDFTANVEKDFDQIADGDKKWNSVIESFYAPFHNRVEDVLQDRNYNRVERDLGVAPDGERVIAKFGQWGPYIQKGEGENKKYANLGKGQLIETLTLEDALNLLRLPRTVGQLDGKDIVVAKGRFGPYIKYDGANVSLPRGKDPLTVTLEECVSILRETPEKKAAGEAIATFGDIQVINGRYGPYIKFDGSNYKIPKGTEASSLTEEDCKKIISEGSPTGHSVKKFTKKAKK